MHSVATFYIENMELFQEGEADVEKLAERKSHSQSRRLGASAN